MIQAIIFDCFGVLYTGSRGYAMRRALPERRQELVDVFVRADYGMITADEFITQAAQLLDTDVPRLTMELNRRYIADDQMIALIRRLRADGYVTGLLSNVNDSLMHELFSDQEQRELFDAVVLSSSVGMVKPSPEIYEYMLRQLGVSAQASVMIDDLENNVTAAESVGMAGITFSTYEQAVRDLQKLGVHA